MNTADPSDRPTQLRASDPRVLRTRAAALTAARVLFYNHGYGGTTMEDIAIEAGLTKRTLYNNFGDKDSLFRQMIDETVGYAGAFIRWLDDAFAADITKAEVAACLESLGVRLALGILRPEVIALRRLLINASRDFPAIGREYFDRAPAQVLHTLSKGFATLTSRRALNAGDGHMAATQFAYLVAGAHLDLALMTGELPAHGVIEQTAREGVATFLARYA